MKNTNTVKNIPYTYRIYTNDEWNKHTSWLHSILTRDTFHERNRFISVTEINRLHVQKCHLEFEIECNHKDTHTLPHCYTHGDPRLHTRVLIMTSLFLSCGSSLDLFIRVSTAED